MQQRCQAIGRKVLAPFLPLAARAVPPCDQRPPTIDTIKKGLDLFLGQQWGIVGLDTRRIDQLRHVLAYQVIFQRHVESIA